MSNTKAPEIIHAGGAAVGEGVPIRDAALKVTGQMKYTADMKLPGMLHGKILFSTVSHAKIKSIDASEAEALPGVEAVVWYKDSPDVLFNSCGEDININKTERLFDTTVRYVGDKVAAVAAVDAATAEKALRLIKVEYEELPANFDPEKAMDADAFPIHPGGNVAEEVVQSIGDVDAAMQKADRVFEGRYSTQPIHHGAIETHTAIASYDAMGHLTVYTPSQDTFGVRINLTRIFGMPMSKVRVITPVIGGAFGGKIDAVLEPTAALLSMKTGKPVKIELNRKDSIASSRTRHAIVVHLKTGMMNDGTIVAQDYKVIANAGAYAAGSASIIWALCSKVFRLFHAQNIRFAGYPVYTNCPVAGAMRGFGSPQGFFATMRQLNEIANDMGLPLEDILRKNLLDASGKDLRTGDCIGNAHPLDCLEKGLVMLGYSDAIKEQEATKTAGKRIGVGMSVAVHGNGVYGVRHDTCGITLKMNEDGTVVMFTGNHDMGNGVVTLQVQMASGALGIPMGNIAVIQADSDATMMHFGDFSSRGTFVCGQAALRCAEQLAARLTGYAAELLEVPAEEITLENTAAKAKNGKSATFEELVKHAYQAHKTDIIESLTYAAEACASSYGAHFAKVEVDTESGSVKVLDYVAVHDVGRAINPLNLEGQVEGAIQMGMGHAFSEDAGVNEKGVVKNQNFRRYKMATSKDMPENIQIAFVEKDEPFGPYGAKSIGECSVVPCIGALGNAVSNALGVDFRALPLTPDVVKAAVEG